MKASTPSSYIPQSLLGTQFPGWETLQQHFILMVWFLVPSPTKDSNRNRIGISRIVVASKSQPHPAFLDAWTAKFYVDRTGGPEFKIKTQDFNHNGEKCFKCMCFTK
jgi:hypothetical protein